VQTDTCPDKKLLQDNGQKAYSKDSQLIIHVCIGAQCIALIGVCVPGNAAIFSVLRVFTGHCRIITALSLSPDKNTSCTTFK